MCTNPVHGEIFEHLERQIDHLTHENRRLRKDIAYLEKELKGYEECRTKLEQISSLIKTRPDAIN